MEQQKAEICPEADRIRKSGGRYRKILLAFLTALMLLAAAEVPAAAEPGGVFDEYGSLDEEERRELEQRTGEIYDRFQFETVFLISRNIGENRDYRQYAAEFMQEEDIGYGESRDGMCVFHQPDARNITIVFRGEAQKAFTDRIQNIILDNCTEKLREEDTYGAYCIILDDLEKGLSREASGKTIRPVDLSHTPVALVILKWILISFGAAAVPALFLTWYQRHRMITEVPQPNADAYTEESGFQCQEMRDMFVYRTVTRTRKPDEHEHHGGSSGSFTSGGESFSGSSRNY